MVPQNLTVNSLACEAECCRWPADDLALEAGVLADFGVVHSPTEIDGAVHTVVGINNLLSAPGAC
jgi:hypothetical protein